jgi:outer membrane receptor protein involved in Fe transport
MNMLNKGISSARACRLLVAASALSFAAALTASAAYAQEAAATRQFNVPAQPLNRALLDLGRQAGISISAPSDLTRGKTSHAVSGRLTTREALFQLLQGSGLTFQFVNPSAVRIFSDSAPSGTRRPNRVSTQAGDGNPATDDADVADIVVTAQRRAQSVQDVPISIGVVSSADIRARRITNALDLSYAVPGLSVAELSPGRQIISIRGIGSQRGSSSLTGIYLDEIPASGAQDGFVATYLDLRTLDLSRIEVLKGPQGTLFGEGAVGGAIRYITNEPNLTRASLDVSASLYGTKDGGVSSEAVATANIPLITDALGLRMTGTVESKAGWIDQPSTGRTNINDNEVYHLRTRLLWQPTHELKIGAMVVLHHTDAGASNIVNQAPYQESNFLQAVDRNAPTNAVDKYQIYNLTLNYDFGFAELLSSTSRTNARSRQSFTQLLGVLPTPSLEILAQDYTLDSRIDAQEFRLTSSGQHFLNWTMGGLYKNSRIEQDFVSGLDANLFSGAAVIRGLSAGSLPVTLSRSVAVYGDVTLALTPRLDVGGGLRYFRDRRQSFDAANRGPTFLSATFNATTYRAFVNFLVSDGIHIYATVGDGFRSGGFNGPGNIALGAPTTYRPERVRSYEAGLKTEFFDRTLRINVAAFSSRYLDMQDDLATVSPIDGVSFIQYTANEQSARLRGIEAELNWRPIRGLSIALAGDVTDSDVTRVTSLSAYAVGDPINFVPNYTLNASTEYEFGLTSSTRGFVRADYNRHGKSYFSSRNNGIGALPQAVAPAVGFLNMAAGVRGENWEVSIFGRNLTDERDIIRPSESGATAQARPLTVGITASRSF